MADTFRGIITADGKKRQLSYGSVLEAPVSDETLSIQGGFADAKVVGDNFKKTKAETDSLKEDLNNKIITDASINKANPDEYDDGIVANGNIASLNQGYRHTGYIKCKKTILLEQLDQLIFQNI